MCRRRYRILFNPKILLYRGFWFNDRNADAVVGDCKCVQGMIWDPYLPMQCRDLTFGEKISNFFGWSSTHDWLYLILIQKSFSTFFYLRRYDERSREYQSCCCCCAFFILGGLPGIPTQLWHCPQVVPWVFQTTDSVHLKHIVPNRLAASSDEPNRLIPTCYCQGKQPSWVQLGQATPK